MTEDDLLSELRALEVEMHAPNARFDKLLHPDFDEFGRSGTRFNKADILASASSSETFAEIRAWDFELVSLSSDAALLLYKSERINSDGKTTHHALRSSLWVRTPDGWQIRFHQGTATS